MANFSAPASTATPPGAPTTAMANPWSAFGTTDPSTLSNTGLMNTAPSASTVPTGTPPPAPSFSLGAPSATSTSMPGMSGAMSIPEVLAALGSQGGVASGTNTTGADKALMAAG